ncbi:MAG: hypothetical protein J7M13_09600 [Synergistetes bacterium]|nr:hypothetical protein [Synergistota bacterium]
MSERTDKEFLMDILEMENESSVKIVALEKKIKKKIKKRKITKEDVKEAIEWARKTLRMEKGVKYLRS